MRTLSGYLCACVPGVDGSSGEPRSISGSDLVCACLGSQRLPSPRLRNGFDTVGMCSSVIKNRNDAEAKRHALCKLTACCRAKCARFGQLATDLLAAGPLSSPQTASLHHAVSAGQYQCNGSSTFTSRRLYHCSEREVFELKEWEPNTRCADAQRT